MHMFKLVEFSGDITICCDSDDDCIKEVIEEHFDDIWANHELKINVTDITPENHSHIRGKFKEERLDIAYTTEYDFRNIFNSNPSNLRINLENVKALCSNSDYKLKQIADTVNELKLLIKESGKNGPKLDKLVDKIESIAKNK